MSDPELPLWQNTCREHLECTDLSDTVTADLAIIGGGYTGCSAALTAARAGASTVLLEAHDIGHGGSGRNVGLVNAGLWVPQDDIRAHLGHEAGNRLITLLAQAPSDVFQLIAEHDIACEPVRNGTLHCAHSPSGYRDIGTRHTQHVASGAPVELLSAQQVQQRTGSAGLSRRAVRSARGNYSAPGLCSRTCARRGRCGCPRFSAQSRYLNGP